MGRKITLTKFSSKITVYLYVTCTAW